MVESAALVRLVFSLLAAPLPQGAGGAAAPKAEPPEITFKEVAKASGVDVVVISGEPEKPRIVDTLGGGLTWFDYDGDGWLDLFVPNGATLDNYMGRKPNPVSDRLYRNLGNGSFADVTDQAGLHDGEWSMSATAGDYDNDGDEDLYVCNFGLNRLYRNNGDGTFTDIAKEAGVQFDGVTPGAAWGDIDLDGDLDLYVSAYISWNRNDPLPPFAKTMRNMKVMLGPRGLRGESDRLFRNDGGGKFTDITKEAGLDAKELDHGFTIQILDLDGDDLPEIFVADDMTPNLVYKSVGIGKFKEIGAESGLAVSRDGKEQACMGIALADLNDDRIPDFVVTNFAAELNSFYVSTGTDTWEDTPDVLENSRPCRPFVKWGIGFFDFDRDGNEDLMMFTGHVYPQVDGEASVVERYEQPSRLYRNDGDLRFTEVSRSAGDLKGERCCRGSAFADYDEDGDVDVAVMQMDRPVLLFRNETATAAHFVKVAVEGTTGNRDGYGARITVEAGGRTATRWVQSAGSFISQNDPRGFFGLGATTTVDKITVRWPGGKEDEVAGPLAADRTYIVREGAGKVATLAPREVRPRPKR